MLFPRSTGVGVGGSAQPVPPKAPGGDAGGFGGAGTHPAQPGAAFLLRLHWLRGRRGGAPRGHTSWGRGPGPLPPGGWSPSLLTPGQQPPAAPSGGGRGCTLRPRSPTEVLGPPGPECPGAGQAGQAGAPAARTTGELILCLLVHGGGVGFLCRALWCLLCFLFCFAFKPNVIFTFVHCS